MGLLSKLKSLLGMEEDRQSPGSGVDVTVEREPSTESESAVEEPADSDEASTTAGSEESPDSDEASLAGDVDEPVATETEAAASTESLVDEEHTEDPTRAAEPGEAASIGGDSDEEPAADEEDEADESATDESGEEGGESVSVVKGIGPAYADRLEEAGVATIADLAAADPEDLADRTDLSAKRVGRWVERAQGRE